MSAGKISAAMTIVSAAVLTVAGCGLGRTDDIDYSRAIVVGTTDKVFSLDPAAAYDNGSLGVQTQIYSHLLYFAPGRPTPAPDVAQRCEFTQPTRYTCVLKPGLRFANGNALTAHSVKFSFDRMLGIDDPNGPASLLTNLVRTDAPDDVTVTFTLKSPNDQTFPLTLPTQAGQIIDEKSFPADRVLDDNAVVARHPFAGPYTIASYAKNRLVEFHANPHYRGLLGTPRTPIVVTKYYVSSENLKLDLQNNAVDIGWRTFNPQDIDSLRASKRVRVFDGPGGETRAVAFNLRTMPGSSPDQKLAVRKAVAASVDRTALADGVFRGTFQPLYSPVPPGVPGAREPLRSLYGDTPNPALAARLLADAGVSSPVTLRLQYSPDHYGAGSAEEYAAVKSQLEATGLFHVDLQSTEWVTYSKERVRDAYPLYQIGWYPDFPDADTYLNPFFGPNNFLQSHFSSAEIEALLVAEESEPDSAKRLDIIGRIQDVVTRAYLPTLPLLAGRQIVVAGKDIQGITDTLDASFLFRFTVLAKS